EGEQCAVAERHLALVADQHVQTDSGNRVIGNRLHRLLDEAVIENQRRDDDCRDRDQHQQHLANRGAVENRQRQSPLHSHDYTFSPLTRSNTPIGFQARITINKKNVTASRNDALKMATTNSMTPSNKPAIRMPNGLPKPPIIATAKAFKPGNT